MNDQQTIDAAIAKCHQAWTKQIEAYNRKEGKQYTELDPGPYCKHYAGLAYRMAMPYLSSSLNIDAFIACVTHGMSIGAIEDKLGTKLLYASQVATTSRKAQHQMNKDQANQNQATQPSSTAAAETTGAPRSSSASAGTNSANPANSAETGVPPSPSQPANPNPINKTTPATGPADALNGTPANSSKCTSSASSSASPASSTQTPPTPRPSKPVTPTISTEDRKILAKYIRSAHTLDFSDPYMQDIAQTLLNFDKEARQVEKLERACGRR